MRDPDAIESMFELRRRRFDEWLKKAHEFFEAEDFDLAYILYWITLNSLYSRSEHIATTEPTSRQINMFLINVEDLDKEHKVYDTVWENYEDLFRNIISNKYIFEPYWSFQRTRDTPSVQDEDWEEQFNKKNSQIQMRVVKQDNVAGTLQLVFERLLTLRNQLIHGSATYHGTLNREQVETGARLLNKLVPVIGEVFVNNPKNNWGFPPYPPSVN